MNDDNSTHLVVDDNGLPIGIFDADMITDEGTRFAFALAAACDEPDAVQRIQAETLARVGTASFGYVAASALSVMVEHILSPSFDVAQAHGTDLRAGMRAIAEGRSPSA